MLLRRGTVSIVVCALILGGCYKFKAKVNLNDAGRQRREAMGLSGRPKGVIVSSDASTVYLQTKAGRDAIPRADIAGIDHPGGTEIGLGLAVTAIGFGSMFGYMAFTDCTVDEVGDAPSNAFVDFFACGFDSKLGVLMVVGGMTLGVLGLYATGSAVFDSARSKSAAGGSGAAGVSLRPTLLGTPDRPGAGLVLDGAF